MANTTWNASDKSANVTLTGSNLIATASGATAWVRAADKQLSGKFYWEYRATVWANGNSGYGLGRGDVAVPNGATPTGLFVVYRTGAIWVNNTNTSLTLGARANNDIISVAVDLDARLGWFRVAPSGNWNGSATANPVTGAGGVSLASIVGGGVQAYPLLTMGANLEAVTANFGDTAFSGTVPSGYTSGFTSGASLPSNVVVTEIVNEEWVSTTPDVQVTQIVTEEWVVPPAPDVQVTQIVVEEWASVTTVTVSPVLVGGVVREALVSDSGVVRTGEVVREALASDLGILRAQALTREVIGAGEATVGAFGLVREVVTTTGGTLTHDLQVSALVRETVGKLPPRLITVDQLIPDFTQTFNFHAKIKITFNQTIPDFAQSFIIDAHAHITIHQNIPTFPQNVFFGQNKFRADQLIPPFEQYVFFGKSHLVIDQTIPDFNQSMIFGRIGLVFNQTIPPFDQIHHYHTPMEAAAGGGGGGAAGIFGIGEHGQDGQPDGTGGYGGAADNSLTPRQIISGMLGNTGIEWDGTYGSGSGGSGGDWGGLGAGVDGGVGGLYGGGGGGGGAGLGGGGHGALGGEGLIYLVYDPGTGPIITLLRHDSVSPFIFPADWVSDNNMIIIIGAGGCGSNGTLYEGGNGGGGGAVVGVINTTLFTPGQVLEFTVPSPEETCAGTTGNTIFGDYEAHPGINGDGTGGGTPSHGFGEGSGSVIIEYEPGDGGPGGVTDPFFRVTQQVHVLIVAG